LVLLVVLSLVTVAELVATSRQRAVLQGQLVQVVLADTAVAVAQELVLAAATAEMVQVALVVAVLGRISREVTVVPVAV
jgi:hypothetical protein